MRREHAQQSVLMPSSDGSDDLGCLGCGCLKAYLKAYRAAEEGEAEKGKEGKYWRVGSSGRSSNPRCSDTTVK